MNYDFLNWPWFWGTLAAVFFLVALWCIRYALRHPKQDKPAGLAAGVAIVAVIACIGFVVWTQDNANTQAEVEAGQRLGWDFYAYGSYDGPPPILYIDLGEEKECPLYYGDMTHPLGIHRYEPNGHTALPEPVVERLKANKIDPALCQ